ncbi:MAG: hypothetical protein WC291_00620, partial [Thermodesulfovibrionales bacterium]
MTTDLRNAQKADIAVGEHFSMELSPADRMLWESSIGDSCLVESLPAWNAPHRQWARRLELKFGVQSKEATLFAYMLYYVAWDRETKLFYEGEIKD